MFRRQFLSTVAALSGAMALSPISRAAAASAAAASGWPQQAPGLLAVLAGEIGPGQYAAGDLATARFHDPRGMALDAQGNVLVADYVNSVVRRIGRDGQVSIVAGQVEQRDPADGPALQARFYSPETVAVGPDGTLYVSDSGSNTIRRIKDGQVSTLAGAFGQIGYADGPGAQARFNHPVGIGVDRTGNVFVADAYNNLIRRITPDGRVSTIAGQAGATGATDGKGSKARFNVPVGLAVAADGHIVVSEYFNNTLRAVTPDGVVTTLAGHAGPGGFADGLARQARFLHPQSLSFAADGSLLIADSGNDRVRRLGRDGRVSTLVGQSPAGDEENRVEPGPLPARLRAPYGVLALPGGALLVTGMNAILRATPA